MTRFPAGFFGRLSYLLSNIDKQRRVIEPIKTPFKPLMEIDRLLPVEPVMLLRSDSGAQSFDFASSFDRNLFADATPRDVGNVDFRFAGWNRDEETMCLGRVARAHPSELRGTRTMSPHVFRMDSIILGKNDREPDRSFRDYFQWIGVNKSEGDPFLSQKWIPVSVSGWKTGSYPELYDVLTASVMFSFTRRYDWRVTVGRRRPVLSFPTDPQGALAAFKKRDLPEGKTRRDPLRHWVESHWRKTSEGETEIHEHLRGRVEFDQADLHWSIEPSDFDKERANAAKARPPRRR